MSVERFKQFVKKHPRLIEDVRSGKKTWKELYNDWYVFGEEDDMWNEYKRKEETPDALVQKMASYLQNIDLEQLQTYIANVQQAIASIQQVVRQMQQTSADKQNPFAFRKD